MYTANNFGGKKGFWVMSTFEFCQFSDTRKNYR